MRIKENRGVCSACIMRALHREGRRWCAIFTLDCHLAYILLYLPSPTIPFFLPEVYGCNCCDAGSYSELCTPPSGYTVVHTHYAHASSAQQCTIYNTLAVARAASKSFKPASSIFSLSTRTKINHEKDFFLAVFRSGAHNNMCSSKLSWWRMQPKGVRSTVPEDLDDC